MARDHGSEGGAEDLVGLEGIERASGIDVAGAIIVHAERYLDKRKLEKRAKKKGRMDVVIEDERRPYRLKKATTEPPPKLRKSRAEARG